MMTGDRYRASLADGRAVYLDGQRIPDPAKHPVLGAAVDFVAAGYDHWFLREPGAVNPLLRITTSGGDLAAKLSLSGKTDALPDLTYQAIMCLLTAAGRLSCGNPDYGARIERYVRHLGASPGTRVAPLQCRHRPEHRQGSWGRRGKALE